MSVLVATSRDQPLPRPDRPPGYRDTATALKTAEPEHRFSPTEKREVQLGPNPARRGELLRN